MRAKLDQDIFLQSNDMELLGVTLDYNLWFEKEASDLCLKGNRKRYALRRVAKCAHFKKRRVVFKTFIESINIALSHGCFVEGKSMITQKINYTKELLEWFIMILLCHLKIYWLKVKLRFIIKILEIEMYKAINNLLEGNLDKPFVRNNGNIIFTMNQNCYSHMSILSWKEKILLVFVTSDR